MAGLTGWFVLSVWLVQQVSPLISPDATSPEFDFAQSEKQCPGADNVIQEIFFSSYLVSGRNRINEKVPLGAPMRAASTLPPGFHIRPASVPGAGLGVFTSRFLRKHTWLAEYEGVISTADDLIDDDFLYYAWEVTADGDEVFFVDGADSRRSNWLRYINGARHVSEENVVMAQCYERVYYRTSRDMAPGTELFVDYGPSYAEILGLEYTLFNDPKYSPTTTAKPTTCHKKKRKQPKMLFS